MRFYSWNVNGLRAAAAKDGFLNWFKNHSADVVAFQETKAAPEQLPPGLKDPEGFSSYWLAATKKKGYSGVGIWSKRIPLHVHYDLEAPVWQGEGRLIHLEFPDFHFYNVYFPNGQTSEERLAYKLGYYEAFLEEAERRRQTKPIIVCGDFNTAHRPIDLARPEANQDISGFLLVERAWLDKFIGCGYVDVFRYLNGDRPQQYSWWSFRSQARARNVGWRIDYFFVSNELLPRLQEAWLEPEVQGSDHCPIGLELA